MTAGGIAQTQEVGGGHGWFGTQRDSTLHFGLGDACRAEVRIRWPDEARSESRFEVGGGSLYHVRQGEDPIKAVLR